MKERLNTQHTDCGRELDLIAYFYGEADERAAADFEHHLASCAKCSDDATAFRSVRTDLAAWREISPQHATPSLAIQFVKGVASRNQFDSHHLSQSERSLRRAWAALAELFRVTPRWVQAGGAFAVLAICALVTLAILGTAARRDDLADNLKGSSATEKLEATQTDSPLISTTVGLTQSELNNLVEREVTRRLDERRLAGTTSADRVTVAVTDNSSASSRTSGQRAKKAVTSRAPRHATSVATANRLRRTVTDDADEDDLPRLSDLLNGAD